MQNTLFPLVLKKGISIIAFPNMSQDIAGQFGKDSWILFREKEALGLISLEWRVYFNKLRDVSDKFLPHLCKTKNKKRNAEAA